MDTPIVGKTGGSGECRGSGGKGGKGGDGSLLPSQIAFLLRSGVRPVGGTELLRLASAGF